ncbi:MAG: hypothetical protein Q7T69_03140 [Rhodoferax sp.]|nr:hypothetical protein [Rhodoferax sp.]
MTPPIRFRCPACGFTVFNRRLATCESCHASLPVALRFTAAELARLAEDEARNAETRKELARQAEELERQRQKRKGDGG